MNRREVLSGLGGLTALGLSNTGFSSEVSNDESAGQWPFRGAVALNQWTKILADGFSAPVSGYVYEGGLLESGVPLGALGTGYMTLEGNGKLGYSSIFNDLVPPKKLFADWLVVEAENRNIPLSSAHIVYWGHYPVADLCAQVWARSHSKLASGHLHRSSLEMLRHPIRQSRCSTSNSETISASTLSLQPSFEISLGS